MQNKILQIFNILLILLFVQNINATNIDNILNTFIYTQNDSTYIILHESIFHPTSGSYEKGNLRAQGYNSSRISVYNILDGKLIAQKNMGVMDSSEYCLLLGCSPSNLWLYSRKHKSGLQSFNPITLESNTSQAKIYNSLQVSIGRLYNGPWHTIKDFYGFDPIKQKLIVTNTQNNSYYIDVKKFTTQKIIEKIKLNSLLDNYFTDNIVFKDSAWKLSGYKDMNLECGANSCLKSTFLYGNFILQQNRLELFKHFSSIIDKITTDNNSAKNIIDSIIDNAQHNINALTMGEKADDVLLQSDLNSLYIYSKSEDRPDAFISISKLESNQFGQLKIQWSTSIPGMFYNIFQARNTKKFKHYFRDITPEFDYQFIQIHNNKLLIIYQSYICCINTNNGDINWRFKL